jgi:hypothetical protein
LTVIDGIERKDKNISSGEIVVEVSVTVDVVVLLISL